MELKVKNVSFSYRNQQLALDDVSFEIKKGQYVSIIGHNGSGKSTLARLLVGLMEAKSGEIIVDGIKLTNENVYDIRDKISIVFQNPDNQFIGSTVKDDLAFGLENRCVDPNKMDDIIRHFSNAVGMGEYLDHEPTKLSGGQKQRVAIASALVMEPEILILDEATSMLDPKGKKEVNDLIHKLHTEDNMTILSITHDVEEIFLSDYVLIMNDGKVECAGTPEEILKDYKQLYDLSLDIPFAYQFYLKLMEAGIKLNETKELESMVDELCKYHLMD